MGKPWRTIDLYGRWWLLFAREKQWLCQSAQSWELIGYTDNLRERRNWETVHFDRNSLYECTMLEWSPMYGLRRERVPYDVDESIKLFHEFTESFSPLANELRDFVSMATGGARKRIRKPASRQFYNGCLADHYGLHYNGNAWVGERGEVYGESDRERSECLKREQQEVEL